MENTITNDQVKAALEIAKAVAEAIRELGSVPSGHLYAQLMGHMSLETYERVIATLVRTGLVRKEPSHLLVWIGPGAPRDPEVNSKGHLRMPF